MQSTLRELVERRVPLGKLSSTGFYSVRCQVCSDHSERAGFKFDGDEVGYSCFNCGTKARSKDNVSASMRKILHAFGVTDNEILTVTGSLFFNHGGLVPNKVPVPVPVKIAPLDVEHELKRLRTKNYEYATDRLPPPQDFNPIKLAALQADYPQMVITWDGYSLIFTPSSLN